MSVIPNLAKTTSAADTSALVDRLAKNADINKDGVVSTAEFSKFLGNILDAFSVKTAAGSTFSTSTTSTSHTTSVVASGPIARGFKAELADIADASTPQFRDSLEGFDLTRMDSAKDSPKYAFANLAQFLPPTVENMRAIAAQLPNKGFVESDGLSFILNEDNGYIGVRDRGQGPIWQWMVYNEVHPAPARDTTTGGNG